MSEELKPCPFCGGEATRTTMRRFKYVSCENSDCSMVVEAGAFFSREEDAIAAWNTRTGEDERIAQAVAAERARVVAALEAQLIPIQSTVPPHPALQRIMLYNGALHEAIKFAKGE